VLALSSQHLRVTSSSSKRPVDWVMTTCLVPEGLPTAAATGEAGGLATMEVRSVVMPAAVLQARHTHAAAVLALNAHVVSVS
jgi:hypothetical protein